MAADNVQGSSILIVDDAPENLRLLVSVLKRGGLIPRPLTSGQQAIDAALVDPPDLVLLDVRMPDISGFEVCRRFKQNPRLCGIPIVFISGLQGTDDKIEAFTAGGVDYIAKPFHEQEVLARIKTHVELGKLRTALESRNLVLTQEQRRAAERLEALSRTARDALVMVDKAGNVTHWNEAAESMFGWSKGEALGACLTELLDPQPADGFAVGRRAITGGVEELARTLELEVRTRSGARLPIEVSLAATELEHDPCTVGIFRDISERKRAEKRLRNEIAERQKVELELRHAQKLEAVGQLASGIAHEINTPTQFVGDSVHFLKEAFGAISDLIARYRTTLQACSNETNRALVAELNAIDEERDIEYLLQNIPTSIERCLDGISRVATIVRSMKEFAHADQREQCPADLNRAIESTIVIARNEYKYVADVETDFGDLPEVVCHVGDLSQVFLNLIVNAAHAIADVVGDSGKKGTIRLMTRAEGEWIRIEVVDTGSGIPEAVRGRIFEPFFTTKPVGKGTGQGLAIARAIIVDKHGGAMKFESEQGKGTTFTLQLPIAGKAPTSSHGPQSTGQGARNPGTLSI